MSSAFEGLPKTPNLKLNKPGYDNVADIEALNENADILDAEIQGIKNTFVKSVNGKEPDAGGNVNVEKYTHPNSGVTAGTYRSVTVNAQGHVTDGSNPTLAIADGGTGATTASDARTNLGLGSVATLNTVPIANGGTGATTKANAQTNLGLNDAIVGLSVNGRTITYTQADGGTGTITTQDTVYTNPAKTYVSEVYRSNTQWYIVLASGMIMQGGYQSRSGDVITITFPKAFSNTNYQVFKSTQRSEGQWATQIYEQFWNKTTTNVKTYDERGDIMWVAFGY